MIGYVYIISEYGDEMLYKIGFTKNHPSIRLKKLSTGNSNEIRLLNFYQSKNYVKIEKMLHLKFNKSRYRGEWFNLTKKEVNSFTYEAELADALINFLTENNSLY
jgi:hypothetical protein